MMKEIKSQNIKIRLTETERKRIEEYCDNHNMTISSFIRWACEKIFTAQDEILDKGSE